MKEQHYKEKLLKFLHRELPAETQRIVGEHILHCKKCRQEHDELKFGIELATKLNRVDSPIRVWNNIEKNLEEDHSPQALGASILDLRKLVLAFSSIVIALGVMSVFYFFAFKSDTTKLTQESLNTNQDSQIKSFSAWQVKDLSGKSTITNSRENEGLKVGATLETDASSSAKIDVANIGEVEVAPNSKVKLVNSSKTEHRLSLERGTLEAKIFAPPRLFVVDTPSAVAVDLGCAYKLEVDEEGNSKLHVTSGYVALEREGVESIVPAGAICFTKRGAGLGTPFSENASHEFRKALRKFDFHNGGARALEEILKIAKARDTISLWHLISRVSKEDRAKVLDKTLSFSELPDGATREGLLRLDQNMLEKLRFELENLWY